MSNSGHNQIMEDFGRHKMTDKDFLRLSSFVTEELGIKMPFQKKIMLQCRLQKRVSDLKMASFSEYLEYVFSHEGQQEEIIRMIDLITTNKTDFFREPAHFDYLQQTVLPEVCRTNTRNKTIRVWSAACSSGEEPYTLAIVLKEFQLQQPDFDFEILGTDISMRILQKAALGIYHVDRIAGIPTAIKQKYFLKSKNPSDKTVRLVPEIRSKVLFRRLNLMDKYYETDVYFDIIFCRNVLIYFDRETQQAVVNKLATRLKPTGFFFLGHSESITNMKVSLRQIRPTIFIKTE
ncbi:MAG TPA: protein-glutamate O-methyltransferase [Bacteroidales bacterium]|nr:protein-glutamate O-methyltransferase [Bacteroidales bacterium]